MNVKRVLSGVVWCGVWWATAAVCCRSCIEDDAAGIGHKQQATINCPGSGTIIKSEPIANHLPPGPAGSCLLCPVLCSVAWWQWQAGKLIEGETETEAETERSGQTEGGRPGRVAARIPTHTPIVNSLAAVVPLR